MAKALHIIPYQAHFAELWDAFVDGSSQGTVFHKQNFLAYHENEKILSKNFHHLLFYRGDALVGLLPLGLVLEKDILTLKSPFGASFGGFITQENSLVDANEMILALLQYAQEKNIGLIKVTPSPQCYRKKLDDNFDFALLKNGFQLVNRDLCQVVDIHNRTEEEIFSSYTYACQKQIRKAERAGFMIHENPDLKSFHALLVENRQRHGIKPTHTLQDLHKLFQLIPEELKLFGIYLGEELQAGMLCFKANNRVLLNFYTCQSEKATGRGISNLLVHESLMWALKAGFWTYDFGTSSLQMEPNFGLIRFKESFGGGSILRDTYLWEKT